MTDSYHKVVVEVPEEAFTTAYPAGLPGSVATAESPTAFVEERFTARGYNVGGTANG